MTKGEQTRQMILKQSAPIFNKKGIAATAMSDIMEATGLSKGSLYVHFDNKDVLAETVVDCHMDQLVQKTINTINRLDHRKATIFADIYTHRTPVNASRG